MRSPQTSCAAPLTFVRARFKNTRARGFRHGPFEQSDSHRQVTVLTSDQSYQGVIAVSVWVPVVGAMLAVQPLQMRRKLLVLLAGDGLPVVLHSGESIARVLSFSLMKILSNLGRWP